MKTILGILCLLTLGCATNQPADDSFVDSCEDNICRSKPADALYLESCEDGISYVHKCIAYDKTTQPPTCLNYTLGTASFDGTGSVKTCGDLPVVQPKKEKTTYNKEIKK